MAFSCCLEAGDELPSHTVLALMDSAEKLAAFASVCLSYLYELAERCVGPRHCSSHSLIAHVFFSEKHRIVRMLQQIVSHGW